MNTYVLASVLLSKQTFIEVIKNYFWLLVTSLKHGLFSILSSFNSYILMERYEFLDFTPRFCYMGRLLEVFYIVIRTWMSHAEYRRVKLPH